MWILFLKSKTFDVQKHYLSLLHHKGSINQRQLELFAQNTCWGEQKSYWRLQESLDCCDWVKRWRNKILRIPSLFSRLVSSELFLNYYFKRGWIEMYIFHLFIFIDFLNAYYFYWIQVISLIFRFFFYFIECGIPTLLFMCIEGCFCWRFFFFAVNHLNSSTWTRKRQ